MLQLLRQDVCHHPGLQLQFGLCASAEDLCLPPVWKLGGAGTDIALLHSKAFGRWRQTLDALGAQTWEVELAAGAPLAIVAGLSRDPALVLHGVYAVPIIPGSVLAALAGRPDSNGGASEGESHVDGANSVTFLDAWYVPETAPDDHPLTPLGDEVGGSGEGDVLEGGVLAVAGARGRYLIATIGPDIDVPSVKRRLSLALRRAWGAEAVSPSEDEDEGSAASESPIQEQPTVEEAAPAADEPGPGPAPPEGPRAWGLQQVILVPQDGSLRVEGPSGEKGIAPGAEAEALIAGLPEAVRARFKGRKRRAKLLVTAEPRGNVWRIIGLGVQKAESEESPEQSD
jgi:hypothetical protein